MSTTVGIYMISGSAEPAQNHGDHGYFGLSIDIDRRFDEHTRALRNGKHGNRYLQNCYNLYGGSDHFIWEVVEECEASNLSEREIAHIDEKDTYRNPKGFNLTPGGEQGFGQAAAKHFAFREIKTNGLLAGINLSLFCREHPEYNYDKMSKLRSGEIKEYKGLIALNTAELGTEKPSADVENVESKGAEQS